METQTPVHQCGENDGQRFRVTVLEERHMISILLYIQENDGCMKTDLYEGVSRNIRMPDKLNVLEQAGMIRQDTPPGSRMVVLHLTDLGHQVCDSLLSIDYKLGGVD